VRRPDGGNTDGGESIDNTVLQGVFRANDGEGSMSGEGKVADGGCVGISAQSNLFRERRDAGIVRFHVCEQVRPLR